MNNMQKTAKNSYILLVGNDEILIESLRIAIELIYDGQVKIASTINQALSILQEHPNPFLIAADHDIQGTLATTIDKFVFDKKLDTLLVIYSNHFPENFKCNYLSSCKFFQKQSLVCNLTNIIREQLPLAISPISKEYCGIRISTLIRLGFTNFDLYVRLTESKYVKLLHQESTFDQEDARKLLGKNINRLYLKTVDAKKLLLEFQENITQIENSSKFTAMEKIQITHEASDLVYNLYQALGWGQEVQAIAEKSIRLAVEVLSQNPYFLELLKAHANRKDSYVADHSSALIYISCGIARYLDWFSDYSFSKLSTAAFLHDIVLTPEQEGNIRKLYTEANGLEISSEEVELYKQHPKMSAALLEGMKNLLPDIDKIILQHHERPDGTGFPFGLTARRIHPLAALFIVAEDLVLFLEGSSNIVTDVSRFISLRKETYNMGHFKKILDAISISMNTNLSKAG